MLLKPEIDVLRKVPFFSGIEPSRLKLIAYTADRVTYRAGQTICKQNQPGDSAFVIIDGEADVSLATDSGEFVVARLKAGDLFGEISILCDMPRTATVTASTELSVLRIRKDAFLQLVHQFPEVATQIMRTLAERLSRTNAELAHLHNGTDR